MEKLKFRIWNREDDDSLVVFGDTIEECKKMAKYEKDRRNFR